MTQPVIFISYSRKDEAEKSQLLVHLKVLESVGFIRVWSDDNIRPGTDWEHEIEEAMRQADVAILLVTVNFLTSDFVLKKEVPELLRHRQREGLTILPIIAKPCAWQSVDWLKRIQVMPKNARPIWGDDSNRVDETLAKVAEEVQHLVKEKVVALSKLTHLDLSGELAQSNVPNTPTIQSISLNTNMIVDGGSITVTIRAESDAPINRINRSLDGPNGNIYGGGQGATFTEVSPGIWETKWIDSISEWAPTGIYTYSKISVKNESQLTSFFWPPLTFIVKNSRSS